MTDLFLTHEGDIRLTTDGTLSLAESNDDLLQSVAYRMKTRPGQDKLVPQLGNLLHTLVGTLLTPETLRRGEALIHRALSGSRATLYATVNVRGVPINATEALFLIGVAPYDGGRGALYKIPFDFQRGIVKLREANSVGNAPFTA